ncbi:MULTISPECIES: VWA-like domain-containing protein [unclassified Clostridium]|uniref:vWA domain-containing protein n=1 Tax=unclassified Clostridium TaxID=2614128 RepID=UPI003217838E
MSKNFEELRVELYNRVTNIVNGGEMFKARRDGEKFVVDMPEDLKLEFYRLVDRVNLAMMEDKENFYGYFLFQVKREIRYDIATPTAISFKGAKYIVYFNPFIFLQLNLSQMQGTIKHEIHHILALHLVRAKELRKKYSTLAVNMAMDIVANQYVNFLPAYATTLEWVNTKYNLKLEPYNSMEYYVREIQGELDLLEEDKEGEEDDSKGDTKDEYDPKKTHDTWDESDDIDDKTLKSFTEKFAELSSKGKLPIEIEAMLNTLKGSENEIPWNIYLKKIMGTLESSKKKTVTRRSRRQPNRLDLKGELRGHRAKIAVAIDISGSISDAEFMQAMKEVLSIVKNYNSEVTIIECDSNIRRTYRVKSVKDIRERVTKGGGTQFTPVFEYINNTDTNLLIYFTDGKGEDNLKVTPKGYRTLWIISGRGYKLSLKEPYGVVKRLKAIEEKDEFIDIHDVRNDGWSMNSVEPTI